MSHGESEKIVMKAIREALEQLRQRSPSQAEKLDALLSDLLPLPKRDAQTEDGR
jgi:3-methyladenine DNA glycosylase AlkD